MMQDLKVVRTSKLELVLAWSIAGIPLLAGVAQTMVNAMKLFH
jgi:orotate phosphoribosyltransferase-like protein